LLSSDAISSSSHFLENTDVRNLVATCSMNDHDWKHFASCYKHDNECRFSFPRKSIAATTFETDNNNERTSALQGSLEKDYMVLIRFLLNQGDLWDCSI
jgi:hypothetical protein